LLKFKRKLRKLVYPWAQL